MTRQAPRARSAPPWEALVHALMEDAETGVLVLDERSRVVESNPAAERLLGVGGTALRRAGAGALLRTIVAGDDLLRDGWAHARTEREVVLHTPGAGEVPALVRTYRVGRPAGLLV